MSNETETSTLEGHTDGELRTSGHVERTVLHYLTGDGEPYRPATVSDILDTIAAVIERGGYENIGPRGTAGATVRKSTVRRAFSQLREKGLVQVSRNSTQRTSVPTGTTSVDEMATLPIRHRTPGRPTTHG